MIIVTVIIIIYYLLWFQHRSNLKSRPCVEESTKGYTLSELASIAVLLQRSAEGVGGAVWMRKHWSKFRFHQPISCWQHMYYIIIFFWGLSFWLLITSTEPKLALEESFSQMVALIWTRPLIYMLFFGDFRSVAWPFPFPTLLVPAPPIITNTSTGHDIE